MYVMMKQIEIIELWICMKEMFDLFLRVCRDKWTKRTKRATGVRENGH